MKLDSWILTAMLSFGPLATLVQGQTSDDGERFVPLTHRDADGNELLYRLLKPAKRDADEAKRPLLLFLHGAGERGSDNKAQLKWGRQMMLTAADRYGCFVVVPQCPGGRKWAEVDWSRPTHKMPGEPSESMRLVMEVLDAMQKQYPIDADRFYIMGLSMGGYGTWDTIQRYPKKFAAAVPICGGGDETAADRIRIPVWAFHGVKDRAVPVSRSRNMIAAMKAAGRKPKYTEFPNGEHNVWTPAFENPELLPWLLSHRREP